MKKIFAAVLLVGFTVGCGSQYDASQAAPETSVEDVSQEIEAAAESGEIDPATYGQE